MDELLDFLKNKKNLVNVLILLVLILALPIGVSVLRQQQIIKSRAEGDWIVFAGANVFQKDGQWFAKKPQIALEITSPMGPPATPTPSPSPLVTPSPSASPQGTPSPGVSPSPLPSPVPGPCNGQAAGTCTFDSRVIVSPSLIGLNDSSVVSVESVTAYGKYWNWSKKQDNTQVPWDGNGSSLESVPRYASGPCAGKSPGTCTFDSRLLLDGSLFGLNNAYVDSVVAYGKYWNWTVTKGTSTYEAWSTNGSTLDSVEKYTGGKI